MPFPRLILTSTSTRFLFSSASLICSCLDTQVPVTPTVSPGIIELASITVLLLLRHSITPFWLVFSPDIWTTRLGGRGLVENEVAGLFVCHDAPESTVDGGGHKNLFSVP